MCSSAFVQSPTASGLDSPCTPGGGCSGLSLNLSQASDPPLTQQSSRHAMCNVQVGMINPVDITPSTFSETDSNISDDILDFAMLYCDSIADEQARLVMHDLGQTIETESWPSGVDEFITTIVDTQNFTNESAATVAALETVSETTKSTGKVAMRSSPVANSTENNRNVLWGRQNSGSCVQGVQKCLKSESRSAAPSHTTQVSSPSPKLNSLPALSSSSPLSKLSKNPKVIFSTKGSQTSFSTKSISVPVTHGLPQKVAVAQNGTQKRETVNGLTSPTSCASSYSRLTSPKPSTSGRHHTDKLQAASMSNPFTFPNSRPPYQTRLFARPSGQRPRSMTELEKHLRGYMDDEVDELQKKHEKVSGKISRLNISDIPDANSIPFLQMLLTGELSQDKYYRIDKELRKKEKQALKKPFSANTNS